MPTFHESSTINAALAADGYAEVSGAVVCDAPIVVPDGARLEQRGFGGLSFPTQVGPFAVHVGKGATLDKVHVNGPGNTSTADGVFCDDKAMLLDCSVRGWRAGAVLVGNHQQIVGGALTGNALNVFFGPGGDDFGDQVFTRCDLAGATLASIAVDPGNTIDASLFSGVHLGFAPYGILRLPGAGRSFLTSTALVDVAFEACGNGMIVDWTPAPVADVRSVHVVGGSGSSWNASYRNINYSANWQVLVGNLLDVEISSVTMFAAPGASGIVRAQRGASGVDWRMGQNAITAAGALPLLSSPSKRNCWVTNAAGTRIAL